MKILSTNKILAALEKEFKVAIMTGARTACFV